jgi:hypothetical protein
MRSTVPVGKDWISGDAERELPFIGLVVVDDLVGRVVYSRLEA